MPLTAVQQGSTACALACKQFRADASNLRSVTVGTQLANNGLNSLGYFAEMSR